MVEPATASEPTDDDALIRAVAEARAQVAAGQTIPLRDVADWLNSWGTSVLRRRGNILRSGRDCRSDRDPQLYRLFQSRNRSAHGAPSQKRGGKPRRIP